MKRYKKKLILMFLFFLSQGIAVYAQEEAQPLAAQEQVDVRLEDFILDCLKKEAFPDDLYADYAIIKAVFLQHAMSIDDFFDGRSVSFQNTQGAQPIHFARALKRHYQETKEVSLERAADEMLHILQDGRHTKRAHS